MTSSTVDRVGPGKKRGIDLSNLDWATVSGIAAMHLGCLAAPYLFSWTAVVLTVVLMWASGGLGITLGFHRLLTHRSFKCYPWLQYGLTLIGCLAWQGGPVTWVSVHRVHHRHSDEDGDPHTPTHGFAWAHMFWCMHKIRDDAPEAKAAQDLRRDPVMQWINRFFWIPQVLLAVLLATGGYFVARLGIDAGAGAWSWLIWGICVRTVIVYHGTWFVNSATHTWGYRNFETKDQSTNLWWVALLSFGEGWHNNHHAHQRSAAHGLRWFEFDVTYLTIRLLAALGLAWDVVVPKLDRRL